MKDELQNYKLVIVGDPNVGKTNLFSIYANINYMKEATILANYKTKKIKINDDGVEKYAKINMWDISGSDTYETMVKNYYTNSHGIVFVFDLNDIHSFYNIPKWINKINDVIDLTLVKKILIGNKSDKIQKVSNAEIYELITVNEMQYFETTTASVVSINNAFDYLINEIVKANSKNRANSFVLRDDKKEKTEVVEKNSCCTIS